MLSRICKKVEQLGVAITNQYAELRIASSRSATARTRGFQRSVAALQRLYPRFYFKQKVTEGCVHLADQRFAKITAPRYHLHHRPHAPARKSVPVKKED